MFVSEFRNLGNISQNRRKYLKEVGRRKNQIKMLKLLSELKNKYNLKVIIALVSNRPDKEKYRDLKSKKLIFLKGLMKIFYFTIIIHMI